jgi:hypothetical protein
MLAKLGLSDELFARITRENAARLLADTPQ